MKNISFASLKQFIQQIMPALKILYVGSRALFALIGLYTVVSWYWMKYVYGKHTNSYVEDIAIVQKTDTLFQYKKISKGMVHLDFVKGVLEIGDIKNGPFEMKRIPKGSEIILTDYKEDRTQATVIYF